MDWRCYNAVYAKAAWMLMSQGDVGPKKRFGVFEFDPLARELTKNGVRLKVQEQPIQVLFALLDQPGQIVAREELQRRLCCD